MGHTSRWHASAMILPPDIVWCIYGARLAQSSIAC